MPRLPDWILPGNIFPRCLLLSVLLLATPGRLCANDPASVEASQEADQTSEETSEETEEPTAFNYVLFLKKPRLLTPDMLAQAAAKAWELDLADARNLKISLTKNEGTIRYQGVTFEITAAPEPWLEDQAQIIKETNDRQMRAMLRRVTSHLAITIQNDFKDEDALGVAVENQVRLLGGFVNRTDTLAIYDDDAGDFNYIDDEVLAALAGEDPHAAFEINVAPLPGKVSAQNPAVTSAIAEAKRRWPEFAKSFRDYGEERGPYLIKANFSEGDAPEALWCEIITLRTNKITAVLRNEPAHHPNLSKGDQVSINITDLTDWTYPDDEGDRIGAFTVDLPER